MKIRTLFGIILSLTLLQDVVYARQDEFNVLHEPILSVWKDSNAPICVAVPSGQLVYQPGVKLISPLDGQTYVMTDKNDSLGKTILHCATGAEVTIRVSTIVPGLIMGMVDFEGNLVEAELHMYSNPHAN